MNNSKKLNKQNKFQKINKILLKIIISIINNTK